MNGDDVRFGPFRLDVGRRELTRDGVPLQLGGRAFDILLVLAQANGEVVTKDELMTRVWQGVVVEENAIQVHVSALRKALGERAAGESYIATVSGRGYRLVPRQPPPASTAVTSGDAAFSDRPSIALLPFRNLSDDPDQEYFTDGMVDDIITGLSRIKWLFVIARNSSFAYKGKAIDVKQVGRELGVRYILEGGVRKAGNRIRMSAQLVEAETGAHIWAERYDRLLDDIFAVQDELTMSVVGAIEPNLRKAEIERVRRKRPDNLYAYDLVLRALPLLYSAMPATMESAIPLLEKAIEIESGYARAHADLAWCLHHRFSRGDHREEDRQAAIGHANAAIAGARDDATALAIAAFVISLDARDNARALDLFDRALALSNSNIFALSCSAVILAWSGHTGLAIERASRALRLSPFDPLNDRSFNAISIACFHERRFEDAADAARRAIECNPGFSVPHLLLSAALLRLGRGAEARAVAQHGRKLQSNFTIRSFESTVGFAADVFAGFAKAWADAGLPE